MKKFQTTNLKKFQTKKFQAIRMTKLQTTTMKMFQTTIMTKFQTTSRNKFETMKKAQLKEVTIRNFHLANSILKAIVQWRAETCGCPGSTHFIALDWMPPPTAPIVIFQY